MTGDMDEFKKRIKGAKWPIFKRTHHRNEIKKGDQIIFYLGGKPNKNIMGTAMLSSDLVADSESDYSTSISKVDIWKKPLPMKSIVGSLDLVENKDNWGLYLQGGIIPISINDYDIIMEYKTA